MKYVIRIFTAIISIHSRKWNTLSPNYEIKHALLVNKKDCILRLLQINATTKLHSIYHFHISLIHLILWRSSFWSISLRHFDSSAKELLVVLVKGIHLGPFIEKFDDCLAFATSIKVSKNSDI